MSAEILRRAAQNMREYGARGIAWGPEWDGDYAADGGWLPPVVALAVADWLWEAADHEDIHGDINCKAGCLHPTCRVADRALTAARAYLGEQA